MDLHLYVIQGKENMGKTTTCWKLFNLLKSHVECYNYWKLTFSDDAVYNKVGNWYEHPNKTNVGMDTNDFISVTRIDNPSHCKVGIISAGDEAHYVKEHIYKLLANDVHHIVCCSRTVNKAASTITMLRNEFRGHIDVTKRLTQYRDTAEQTNVATDIFNKLIAL